VSYLPPKSSVCVGGICNADARKPVPAGTKDLPRRNAAALATSARAEPKTIVTGANRRRKEISPSSPQARERLRVNLAIQTEVIGPGIQKNKYGLTAVTLMVFNVLNVAVYRLLDHQAMQQPDIEAFPGPHCKLAMGSFLCRFCSCPHRSPAGC
jgi:hypothetical protein